MNEEGHMGIGSWFYVILQNMLICLKLLDVIAYSWWKVFTPSFVLAGILFIGTLAVFVLHALNGNEEGKDA
jgi:hypothetical protein